MLKLATKLQPNRQTLELAYRAGFRHTELFLDEQNLLKWQQTLETCREFPFTYVPHFTNKTISTEALEGILHLYHELNCQAMVIHEPMFAKYEQEIKSRMPRVRLGIENHFKNPAQLQEFAQSATYITLDIEHLWVLTWPKISQQDLLEKFKQFWNEFGDKVIHIHFPGPRADEPFQHRPMYNNRELVFAVFDHLHSCGYKGLIVAEVDQYYQTYPELHMDVLLFESWRNTDRNIPTPCRSGENK